MTGGTWINLLKFQLCLLVIMLIFAKVNGQPLSDSFYYYFLSIIAIWCLLTLLMNEAEGDQDPQSLPDKIQ